jgi:hypothetical protein
MFFVSSGEIDFLSNLSLIQHATHSKLSLSHKQRRAAMHSVPPVHYYFKLMSFYWLVIYICLSLMQHATHSKLSLSHKQRRDIYLLITNSARTAVFTSDKTH